MAFFPQPHQLVRFLAPKCCLHLSPSGADGLYYYYSIFDYFKFYVRISIQEANTFSMATKHRGFLVQTPDEKEFFDWLYAVSPLLAGQMRSD